MRAGYSDWLEAQGYAANTCAAQLHRVQKVEQAYGALDDLLREGGFDGMIAELTYSTADERHGRPNPSRLTFEGNIRNNLQSYKNAALRYARFRSEQRQGGIEPEPMVREAAGDAVAAPPEKQRLALERDMQTALRRRMADLDPGLTIVDDGAERAVESGFIDILCQDGEGRTVVIELKAGTTDARVIAQILGYMGDLVNEDPDIGIRGIIVAHDFDKRTRAAARAVPNVALYRYAVSFTFDRVD